MAKIIEIPYYEPNMEIIEALPKRIVLEDRFMEVFSKYTIINKDSESDNYLKEVKADYVTLISKKNIGAIEMGKPNATQIGYVVNVYYAEDTLHIFFETKKPALDFYNSLKIWYKELT